MRTIESPQPSPSTPSRPARRSLYRSGATVGLAAVTLLLSAGAASAAPASLEGPLGNFTDTTIGSVVAPNGDKTPFSIAVIPVTAGNLTKGNLLVAEYSDAGNEPGWGTTLLQVDPATGASSAFYVSDSIWGPVGIALSPTNDTVWLGDFGIDQNGSDANMAVVSNTGTLVTTYTNANTAGATNLTGVWGQGVSVDNGKTSFYWGNAGNAATGTGGGDVWRVDPNADPGNGQPLSSTYTELASGQGQSSAGGNPTGPQDFAYDSANGTLYETNDADSTIYAIPNAATATGPTTPTVVYNGSDVDGPENLVLDPSSGNLFVVNSGDDTLVELTTSGQVVGVRQLIAGGPSLGLFGLAETTDASGNPVFYYTNDVDNTLHELTETTAPTPALPETPFAAGLPLIGVVIAGGAVVVRRRRSVR